MVHFPAFSSQMLSGIMIFFGVNSSLIKLHTVALPLTAAIGMFDSFVAIMSGT